MKKLIMLLAILIMPTQLLGCFKLKYQIRNTFTEFIDMLEVDNLMFILGEGNDKKNARGDEIEWDPGVNETWQISSSFENYDDSIDVTLYFDTGEKKAEGNVFVSTEEDDDEGYNITGWYSVYYDEEGLHLKDNNLPKSLKKKVEEFRFLNEFLDVDKEYINRLKPKRIYYSWQPKSYTAQYELSAKDRNIKKIKELYPDLKIDEKNLSLKFKTPDKEWDYGKEVELFLDDKFNVSFSFSAMNTSKWEEDEKKEIVDSEVAVIQGRLNNVITDFNNENLDYLYDKEGGKSIIQEAKEDKYRDELENGDLGEWNIISQVSADKFVEERTSSTVAYFREVDQIKVYTDISRNTRTKETYFWGERTAEGTEKCILNEIDIDAIDRTEEEKEMLRLFKPMNKYIQLDKEYLDGLEIVDYWGAEESVYGITYKLNYFDENIKKIKEIYPNLEVHDTQCLLQISGSGSPWNIGSSVSVGFILTYDEDAYIREKLMFSQDYNYQRSLEKDESDQE